MEIVVEVIEPGRRAPSIKRFQKTEVTIGRAWDSDLVIVDPELDPQHAKLVFDQEAASFLLEDLHSANGTRHNGRKFTGSVEVAFGDSITVGQTNFRIHRAGDAVAPTKVHSRVEQILNQIGHPAIATASMIAALFLYQSSQFLISGQRFEWENQLQSLLGVATGLIFWAILWGTITRILKHQVKIWSHLALASVIVIVSVVLNEIHGLITFNALSPTLSDLITTLNTALLILAWIFLGMTITSHVKVRPRIVTACALAGLYLLTNFLVPRFQTETWVGLVPLETKSQNPALKISPAQSPDDFMQRIEENMLDTSRRAEELREENQGG